MTIHEAANEKGSFPERERAFFEHSASYSKMLRLWLVGYGVGGPALILSQEQLTKSIVASGAASLIAGLFFSAVLIQVINAFLNKWALHYAGSVVGDRSLGSYHPYKAAVAWNASAWPDILSDGGAIVILSIATVRLLTLFGQAAKVPGPAAVRDTVAVSVTVPIAYFPNARGLGPEWGPGSVIDGYRTGDVFMALTATARCADSTHGAIPHILPLGFASDAPFVRNGKALSYSDDLNLALANYRATIAHRALVRGRDQLGITGLVAIEAPRIWPTFAEMKAVRDQFLGSHGADIGERMRLGRAAVLEISGMRACSALGVIGLPAGVQVMQAGTPFPAASR